MVQFTEKNRMELEGKLESAIDDRVAVGGWRVDGVSLALAGLGLQTLRRLRRETNFPGQRSAHGLTIVVFMF